MMLMRSKGMIISYMFWFWPLKRPGRKGNPRKMEFPQPQCSELNAQIVSRRINARLVVLMSTQSLPKLSAINLEYPGFNLIRLKLYLHVDGHLLGFDLVDCHGSLFQMGGELGYVPRLKK